MDNRMTDTVLSSPFDHRDENSRKTLPGKLLDPSESTPSTTVVLSQRDLGVFVNRPHILCSNDTELHGRICENKKSVLDEPPLLEELGIDLGCIGRRMKSVLLFHNVEQSLLLSSDMCGPLFIVLLLGFSLLLAGKAAFGYIYGVGICGCLGTYILLNLMAQGTGCFLLMAWPCYRYFSI